MESRSPRPGERGRSGDDETHRKRKVFDAREVLQSVLLPADCLDCVFLFGCSKGDALPNGYKVFFASSTEVSLVKPSSGSAECIAGPHVAELGNSGKYIFGRIEFKGAGPAAESSNAGFFVIDSSTDEVKTGLDREKWLAELKAAGIDAPQLDPPEYKWPRH